MRAKYNRVSTLNQSGDRFSADTEKYDLTLLDRISGSVPFMDRPKASELVQLINEGKISEVVVEEFSRLGRNTGDVIRTLEWMEEKEVNVVIRNIGLQSRPMGKRNPVWKMISSVMSSLYEMELENIKERTTVGRLVFVQKGGRLGRPEGSSESPREFLSKSKNKEIQKLLQKKRSHKEIAKILDCSTKTISKVRRMMSSIGEVV